MHLKRLCKMRWVGRSKLKYILHITNCHTQRKIETFLQAQLIALWPRTKEHSYTLLELYVLSAGKHHFHEKL
jgi:hypothetical protein